MDLDKHLFLKENAEIVLAENEALKEKINNLRDQHSIDQQEYSKRIRECKREFMNARNQADDLKQVITQLIYQLYSDPKLNSPFQKSNVDIFLMRNRTNFFTIRFFVPGTQSYARRV